MADTDAVSPASTPLSHPPRCRRARHVVQAAVARQVVVQWVSGALGAFLVVWIVGWTVLARGLPDAGKLLDYEPPLPTVVRGDDGEIVHSYARERRVQLQFQDFPAQLINAYTSAEDKTFWTHGGIDFGGFVGAVIDYVSKIGSGERAVGGSTITQQVAKNILVGDEYSVTRKLKEMMLARRIEGVLTKQEIITLYLNEIPLGRRSFGVQAASAGLFRQGRGRADAARNGLPGDPAQGPGTIRPQQIPRPRRRAAQFRARPDGRERSHHAGRGRSGQGGPARVSLPSGGPAFGRCRLFPRGSAPRTDRQVRRAGRGRPEQRLCRRPVGAHLARHRDAERRARRAARRAAALFGGQGLARADGEDRPGEGRPDRAAAPASISASITRTGASAS